MKTSRFFLFAALLPFLFACAKDPVHDALPDSPAEADPHKVPVQSALAELHSMLEAIDGPETRSGGPRRVASVEALRAADLARATRTGSEAAANVGDLVYIANFENGEGYALLSADDRIESVIAITEQGSLTPAQLSAAANGEYDGLDAPPVVPEVGDYLAAQAGKIIKRDSMIGVPRPDPNVVHSNGEWMVIEQKGPYCKMKWGQGAPYNLSTPVHSGQHCMVGCVAVALGQIVATNYYNKYYPTNMNPDPKTLGGQPVHWEDLFGAIHRYITDPTESRTYSTKDYNQEIGSVALFLSGIGEAIGMKYTIDASSAQDEDAIRFLKAMGYKDVDKYYISDGRLHEMIVLRGLPVYLSGTRSGNVGHAWVADGMKKWKQLHTAYYPSTKKYIYSYNYKTMYHCNFGWCGGCDGYYYGNAVYCPRPDGEKEISEGDRYEGEPRDYTAKHKWMIYYNL